MKVLHITRSSGLSVENAPAGGLERAVSELAQAQRERGIDAVVTAVEPADLSIAGEAALRNDWASVARIAEASLLQADFDIVHGHDWYAQPVVEALYRCGHRAIFATSHLPIRRGFTYRDASVTWRAKLWLEARLFDIASTIVAISPVDAEFLYQEYGLTRERVAVVPHGVNGAVFNGATNSARDIHNPRFLVVGRVTQQKGVELAIRAFAAVLDRLPSATLRIVGGGDRVEACERLAQRLGVSNRLEFVPYTDGTATLLEAYHRSTLLLMPSLFEPFGLVGVEALACGCPVLAVEPTGAAYLEEEELTRHLSPSRFALAILERIATLQRDGIDGPALRARALRWSWGSAAREMELLYSRALQ